MKTVLKGVPETLMETLKINGWKYKKTKTWYGSRMMCFEEFSFSYSNEVKKNMNRVFKDERKHAEHPSAQRYLCNQRKTGLMSTAVLQQF